MFETANYAEAALWSVIAAALLVHAVCQGGPGRWRRGLAAAMFLRFAPSDVVEVQTGAWWRPWWLLCWKAGCVGASLALLVQYAVTKRRD